MYEKGLRTVFFDFLTKAQGEHTVTAGILPTIPSGRLEMRFPKKRLQVRAGDKYLSSNYRSKLHNAFLLNLKILLIPSDYGAE